MASPQEHAAVSEIDHLKSSGLNDIKAIANVGDFAFVVDVKCKGLDMGIKFQIPGDYPDSIPECIVKSKKLKTEEKVLLQEVIAQEAQELTGDQMISKLLQKAVDWALEKDIDLVTEDESKPAAYKSTKQKKKGKKSKKSDADVVEKLPSMKTAEQVISRIQWDENLDAESFAVGYIDRFIGIVEKNFDSFSWEDIASVDYNTLAIPKHRIQYFKYKGVKVWDKSERLDNVFGSTGSGRTIYDVAEDLKGLKEKRETPCDGNDDDDSDDDDVVIATGLEQDSEEQLRPREKYWGKKVHPTHFLALRITDPEIQKSVAKVQKEILEMEPSYEESLIPIERLHITLCCLGLDTPDQIEEAAKKIEKLSSELKLFKPQNIDVKLEGTDHFHGNCLYAKVQQNQKLIDFVHFIRRRVVEIGLEVRDIYDFVPHMTILKLIRQGFVENRTRYFDARIYNSFNDTKFGSQTFGNMHLCSMSKDRNEEGFYVTSFSTKFCSD